MAQYDMWRGLGFIGKAIQFLPTNERILIRDSHFGKRSSEVSEESEMGSKRLRRCDSRRHVQNGASRPCFCRTGPAGEYFSRRGPVSFKCVDEV